MQYPPKEDFFLSFADSDIKNPNNAIHNYSQQKQTTMTS